MNKISYVLLMIFALFIVNSAEAKKKKYPNGDYYEGGWKKKSPNGLGKMTYANGNVYNGNWVFGIKEGQGTMTYKDDKKYKEYIGEWKADKPNGKGKMTYTNGDVYNGSWNLGELEGQGTITYAQNIKYKEYAGEWKAGKPNGMGKAVFRNGDIYDGNWDAGKIHGDGTLTFANGDVFAGTFTENGHIGKLTKNSGEWYDGEWRNEKFINGKCSIANDSIKFDGDIYNGNFFNGNGAITTAGEHFEGTWTNGIFSGTCELNGAKFIGNISHNGKMSGKVHYNMAGTPTFEGEIDKCFWPSLGREIYVPSGKGTLSFAYAINQISTVSGTWQQGELTSLESGMIIANHKPYTLSMTDMELIIKDKEDQDIQFPKTFDEMPRAVAEIPNKIAINGIYEQKLKDKAFVFVGTYDQLEPEAAMFFDISAIDIMLCIAPNNKSELLNAQLALVNSNKLGRNNDRVTLLTLFGMAKKLIKKEFYTYTIDDKYLYFNGKKYKILNDLTALYDEESKLTYKVVDLPELKKLISRFTQQF